jgi:hypothetical protein
MNESVQRAGFVFVFESAGMEYTITQAPFMVISTSVVTALDWFSIDCGNGLALNVSPVINVVS